MALNRADLLEKIREIINARTDDPVEELRAVGQALVDIAAALKGQDAAGARAIISAVLALEGHK